MTPPKVLDELALKKREQQIIDAGILLIQTNGIEKLTMDKVIAQLPFSKGTVYKHFTGKEDLLLAISNQAIDILSDLFFRAYDFKGGTRERMLLLNFSYLIYAVLHPALFQTVICAKTASIMAKSSEFRIKEQEKLEMKLLASLYGIIEEAISDATLVLPGHMNIQQLCFANWSMAYGTIALLSTEVEQCTGRVDLIVERELFNNSNLLFDGMAWAPLTKDKAHCESLSIALQTLFPQELKLISNSGRELKFA